MADQTKKLMDELGLKKKDIDGTVYFPDQNIIALLLSRELCL